MTLEHFKEELAWLERTQKKVGLSKSGELKLFWFRDALIYLEKPILPINKEESK